MPEAVVHLQDVAFWKTACCLTWANNALMTIRVLRTTHPGAGDLFWREEAMANGMDPESLAQRLQHTAGPHYFLQEVRQYLVRTGAHLLKAVNATARKSDSFSLLAAEAAVPDCRPRGNSDPHALTFALGQPCRSMGDLRTAGKSPTRTFHAASKDMKG
jgi:hypothetical protein